MPCSSGVVSSRTERKPIRWDQLSTVSPPGSCTVTSIGWRACSPYPGPPQGGLGDGESARPCAARGMTASALAPATAARIVRGRPRPARPRRAARPGRHGRPL
ncbi:hypothetical protein NKG94_26440 [Micromonospora sp. M12]